MGKHIEFPTCLCILSSYIIVYVHSSWRAWVTTTYPRARSRATVVIFFPFIVDTSCSSDDIEIVGDEVICPAKEFGPFLCTARGRNMQVDNLLFLGSDQEGTIRMNNHTRAELIRVTHENGEGSALGTRVAKIHITLGPDSESLVITCGADDVGMCNYTISVVGECH